MGLQKELVLPQLPYRLAVISAEDAAGYRDFIRHLEENPYGFSFDITLFPALMQGVECPRSVISALDSVMECDGDFDVVLVLRGGGSKLDLACFDDYEMAAVIAQFPLPVLTAIGHDQDYHVYTLNFLHQLHFQDILMMNVLFFHNPLVFHLHTRNKL